MAGCSGPGAAAQRKSCVNADPRRGQAKIHVDCTNRGTSGLVASRRHKTSVRSSVDGRSKQQAQERTWSNSERGLSLVYEALSDLGRAPPRAGRLHVAGGVSTLGTHRPGEAEAGHGALVGAHPWQWVASSTLPRLRSAADGTLPRLRSAAGGSSTQTTSPQSTCPCRGCAWLLAVLLP